VDDLTFNSPWAGVLRRKWWLVTLFWLAQAAGVFLGWPLFGGGTTQLTEPTWFVSAGVTIVLLTGAQFAFLLPVRRPMFSRDRRTPLYLSLAIAAAFFSLLVVAILMTIADVFWLITNRSIATDRAFNIGIVVSIGLSWLVATPLLIAFSRKRRPESVLSRLAVVLFGGTVVESIAIIPIDVMVRRKTDCYCDQGTFLALTATAAVGLFALGPALLLPFVARRRARCYQGRCFVCGYDMSGTPSAERCPECGAGWRPDSRAD
jgi:hypothetical protein